jgi:hypothetical protein
MTARDVDLEGNLLVRLGDVGAPVIDNPTEPCENIVAVV